MDIYIFRRRFTAFEVRRPKLVETEKQLPCRAVATIVANEQSLFYIRVEGRREDFMEMLSVRAGDGIGYNGLVARR